MPTTTEHDEDWDLPPPVMVTMPCGTDFYACRALVRDSWLQWRDALPPEQEDWERITSDVVENIQSLAKAIHHLHRSLPGYKQCDESPFTVSRWWDPDDDEGWQLGGRCLFRFKDTTSFELIEGLPRKTQLQLTRISENWVEASLQSH